MSHIVDFKYSLIIKRVEQHTGYYPYGEPWREPAGQPYLFGGKERRQRLPRPLPHHRHRPLAGPRRPRRQLPLALPLGLLQCKPDKISTIPYPSPDDHKMTKRYQEYPHIKYSIFTKSDGYRAYGSQAERK